MTKATPARVASEPKTRGNGSSSSALNTGVKLQNQTTRADKPEGFALTVRGFVIGDRVVSTSPYGSAGKTGTVRSVEHHPMRYSVAGGPVAPRDVVTVDLDEGGSTAFIADGDERLHLAPLAGMPKPLCPPWCDRRHGGFDAVTSFGDIAVQHTAERGEVVMGTIEFLEPDGSRTTTSLSLDLPNSAGDYEAASPAELAADVRGLMADLAALADVLDGKAVDR
ncbi:hypothetical protein EV386_0700 [Xylanimonas ulmi]|uniref:Uncharacterized protein n=1 Tax=Xylanimonas ulmi TaxID=228973 RepID=A0A4Q7M1J3_9MICO|nr:hypothetical protein EV386_0700 [Xylanibacterium ulmi]